MVSKAEAPMLKFELIEAFSGELVSPMDLVQAGTLIRISTTLTAETRMKLGGQETPEAQTLCSKKNQAPWSSSMLGTL